MGFSTRAVVGSVVVVAGVVALGCGSKSTPEAETPGVSTVPPPTGSPPAPSAPSGPAPEPTASATPAPEDGVVCTMDVKRCPDGTEVGRSGPRCEFAPCPEAKTCTSNADCADGESCVGELGCDATWHCAKVPCTRDLATYCGCDGKTFQGSGSCPSKKAKKRGAC